MKNIFITLFIILFSISAYSQVSVIAHPSVSESSIKADMAGKVYSLDITKWSNNSKIVVVDLSVNNNVKTKFYSFISKDPIALQKEWLKKQITGEAKAPVTAGSDEEVIKIVSSTPGAVGYVSGTSVKGNVKVLAVIQ